MDRKSVVLLGVQWGDEGKAKIIDTLAEKADIVARFQGGNNAGHTIVANGEKTILHLIPSGILHPQSINLIGNGVVFDMQVFLKEKQSLQEKGIDVSPSRLKISEIVHCIFPFHCQLDLAREKARTRIGTTGRGIGPAYGDKAMRLGVRLGDWHDPQGLKKRLEPHYEEKRLQLEDLGGTSPVDFETFFSQQLEMFHQLKDHLIDSSSFLNKALNEKKKLVFEGAQGTLLDIDYGTYPFVTSSNTTAAFAACGTGVGPSKLDYILGLTKAYTTRVGSGPFPTECLEGSEHEEQRKWMAEKGNEFGSTTGRARRCGWLDLVALRRAVELNGVHSLALSKMDILSQLKKVKLCVRYESEGKPIETFPNFGLEKLNPVYEELEGWGELRGICQGTELPSPAKSFIEKIESFCQVPVSLISTGPDRSEMIVREKIL